MAVKIIAEGQDLIAARIKEIAREHDIPVISDPPLARALHASVEVDRQIPDELFGEAPRDPPGAFDVVLVAGVESPLVVYIRKDTPPGINVPADLMKAQEFKALSLNAQNTNTLNQVLALDGDTGKEIWRFHTIPGPGEPGDESWGNVPMNERWHVGTWMVPSYDPELNLIYVGTSVTIPAPAAVTPSPARSWC